MRGVVALTVAALAATVLSVSGSSGVVPASAARSDVNGPGAIVFVAGARAAGHGKDNSELVATGPNGGVRDLTLTAASENYPAWSADGRHVIFGRQATGAPSAPGGSSPAGLYVWSPGHGTPHRIRVCAHCWESGFAWSPDDRHIAFVVNGTNGESAIRVMNPDGSGAHTVCNAKRCGPGLSGPTWSPDGRRLLFSNEGVLDTTGLFVSPPSAIWVAMPDRSRVEKLTQPNCNEVAGKLRPGCAIDTAPAWSPNGRLIAFSRMNIDFVRTRGSCFSPVGAGPPPKGPHGPFGSPPSTVKIVRCARVERANGIKVMRADGSQLHTIGGSRRCADQCGPNPPFAWSPDGQAIAYTRFVIHRPPRIGITTLAGKTTTIRACVSSHCLWVANVAWSPSGEQLAFLVGLKPTTTVWVTSRDGSGLHRVAPGGQCCLQWVRNSSLSH